MGGSHAPTDGNAPQGEEFETGHTGAGSGVAAASAELELSRLQFDETEALADFARGALTEARREREAAEAERVEMERQRRERAERERAEKEERDRERKVES